MKECERIIKTLEHFYGHLEIECCGSLGLCSVECKEDAKNARHTCFVDRHDDYCVELIKWMNQYD